MNLEQQERKRLLVDTLIGEGNTVKEIVDELVKNNLANSYYKNDTQYIYYRSRKIGIPFMKLRDINRPKPGDIFNDLTLIEFVEKKSLNSKKGGHYKFQCICGKVVTLVGSNVFRGERKSCGCKRHYYENLSKRNIKSITPRSIYNEESIKLSKKYPSENKIWGAMKQRCYNPKHNRYYLYGERGIKVCDRWLECFKNFFDDMGPRPSNRHSIDRIDSNGMYEPSNCRWATYSEQNTNKSWEIYECDKCGTKIGQKSNFNKHMKVHEREDEILELYHKGVSSVGICKVLGLSKNTVGLLLSYYGIKRRVKNSPLQPIEGDKI